MYSDKDSIESILETDQEYGNLFIQLKEIEEEEETHTTKSLSSFIRENKEKSGHRMLDDILNFRVLLQKPLLLSNQLPDYDLMPIFRERAKIEEKLSHVHQIVFDLFMDILEVKSLSVEGSPFDKPNRDDIESSDLDTLWQKLQYIDEKCWKSLLDTLEKWWDKAHFNSKDLLQKKFTTINQGIKAQVSFILKDKEKLIKKTKLSRNNINMIKNPKKPQEMSSNNNSQSDEHLNRYYEEIFDDTDFYQSLLRDFIDFRPSPENSTSMASALEFVSKPKQKKIKIEQRASKGRLIKYDIIPKLSNFMTPISLHNEWTDEKMDRLFSSLPQLTAHEYSEYIKI